MASKKKNAPGAGSGATAVGKSAGTPAALHFSTVNLVLGGAGLAALALGYFLLAQGSITAAPILLVLGYVVLVPLALIL